MIVDVEDDPPRTPKLGGRAAKPRAKPTATPDDSRVDQMSDGVLPGERPAIRLDLEVKPRAEASEPPAKR